MNQSLTLSLAWTLLESVGGRGGVLGTEALSHPAVPDPTLSYLPRAHIAAEGISVAATSSVQHTLINGHTDAPIPAPAFVARAVVGAQVPRDTLSL
jgi:hypothetical protein